MVYSKLNFYTLYVILLVSYVMTLETESVCGGHTICRGEFKYMVSLQVCRKSICGGGILDDYHILTVAHCICDENGKFTGENFKIFAGKIDLSEKKVGVKVEVEKVYVHKGFLPDRLIDDIAVIKLKQSLNIAQNPDLVALRLPDKNVDYLTTYVNKVAVISGYGWDWISVEYNEKTQKSVEVGGVFRTTLKYALVKVISNKECAEKNPHEVLTDTFICAQMLQRFLTLTEGVCSGDSGGPLVIDNDVVIGVLSASPFGCDESKEAAIYTRVGPYVDFILDAMNNRTNDDIIVYEVKDSIVKTVIQNLKRSYSDYLSSSIPFNPYCLLYDVSYIQNYDEKNFYASD